MVLAGFAKRGIHFGVILRLAWWFAVYAGDTPNIRIRTHIRSRLRLVWPGKATRLSEPQITLQTVLRIALTSEFGPCDMQAAK
jgi:hypothetical protein